MKTIDRKNISIIDCDGNIVVFSFVSFNKSKTYIIKQYKLVSINGQHPRKQLTIPEYTIKHIEKSKINIYDFITNRTKEKWWKLGKQKIKSPISSFTYTIEPIIENGVIKNKFPNRGKTTSLYLITEINNVKLEIPFEVQFRQIDNFIRGRKYFISRPKNKNVLEFFIDKKKNVFRQISKNQYVAVIYKNNKIDRDIILSYDKVHTYQRQDGRNIPELEILINPQYKSIQQLSYIKTQKMIEKAKTKYHDDYIKQFKNKDVTSREIKAFIKNHTTFKNCGYELEQDICNGLTSALSKFGIVPIRPMSSTVSDIKINDFYIESKLDYTSAPLIHMAIQFDERYNVSGTERFKKIKKNDNIIDYYNKLNVLMNTIFSHSNDFQKFKETLSYLNIRPNNMKNDIEKILSNLDTTDIESFFIKNISQYTKKYGRNKLRKILKFDTTDKKILEKIIDFVYFYYYVINKVRYCQIGNDTYIMNINDDPLNLCSLYDIPEFKTSFTRSKIDINIDKKIDKMRLEIRLYSNNRNNIHFHKSSFGTYINKVNIIKK